MKTITRLVVCCSVLLIFSQLVIAEAILFPFTDNYPTDYIPLKKITANIDIRDQVASFTIDQQFYNSWDGDSLIDANYYYPVPEMASIVGFGRWEGEELVYYELEVGEQPEPGGGGADNEELMTFLGENPFYAPLPDFPNGDVTMRLEYAELMEYSFGSYYLDYPLQMGGFLAEPVDTVEINLNISSQRLLNTLWLENYDVEILYQSEDSISVRFIDFEMEPDLPLSLSIQVDPDDSGMWVMPHCEDPDSSGHFLAVLEPGEVEPEENFTKYFIFVLDVSRSMLAENRIDEAKEAAIYCIEHLNPEDYFNIIAFNDLIVLWEEDPVPASLDNIEDAISFIESRTLRNGTDLNAAMVTAVQQEMSDSTANQILLVSDGRPEAVPGELHLPTILNNISEGNIHDASIFTVGVGDPGGDCASNLDFLKMIAYENHGLSIAIPPGEEYVAEQIEVFFDRFSSPAMLDINIDYGLIDTDDIYPPEPYSIFSGTQTIFAGRYNSAANSDITVTGRVVNDIVEYVYGPFEFTMEAQNYPFVPRMWAMSKIDYWLAHMAVHGEDQETIDMIIDLSLRYGILTPYTNFGTGDDDDDDEGGDDNNAIEEGFLTVNAKVTKRGIELDWNEPLIPDGSVFSVYRSNANGRAFLLLTPEPIHQTSFWDNTIVNSGRYTYRVAMRTPDGTTMDGEVTVEIRIDQYTSGFDVYPNPFNNEARINFLIQQKMNVDISIYNILGRKVETLWHGNTEPGQHFLRLDANNLSSGTYFIHLEGKAVNGSGVINSVQRIIVAK